MPVRAVILDLDGTLVDEGDGRIVHGTPEMIARLRALGLKVFVASNRSPRPNLDLQALGLHNDELLLSSSIGNTKGSKAFVDWICTRHSVSRNELLYLGDSDNDMREAVNCRVIFFLAGWSNPSYEYGIKVSTPDAFVAAVETFFLKDHLWYYQIDDADSRGFDVVVRALLNPDQAQQTGIKRLLKQKQDSHVHPMYLTSTFLSMHLLASLYLEGLHLHGKPGKPSLWCIYPGHDGNQTGVLAQFASIVSRLFRRSYEPNLLVRHRPAIKSAYARASGNPPTIENQLSTIHLDPTLRSKIRGRTVLVFDDFTTHAHSFETARNFLRNAGAEQVICIAVGKYPATYYARVPDPNLKWNSFAPAAIPESNFTREQMNARYDLQALNMFRKTP